MKKQFVSLVLRHKWILGTFFLRQWKWGSKQTYVCCIRWHYFFWPFSTRGRKEIKRLISIVQGQLSDFSLIGKSYFWHHWMSKPHKALRIILFTSTCSRWGAKIKDNQKLFQWDMALLAKSELNWNQVSRLNIYIQFYLVPFFLLFEKPPWLVLSRENILTID